MVQADAILYLTINNEEIMYDIPELAEYREYEEGRQDDEIEIDNILYNVHFEIISLPSIYTPYGYNIKVSKVQ